MRARSPRPWEPCGSLRLLVAVVAIWLLDHLADVLMLLRMHKAAKAADSALLRIGLWSGVITDGRD